MVFGGTKDNIGGLNMPGCKFALSYLIDENFPIIDISWSTPDQEITLFQVQDESEFKDIDIAKKNLEKALEFFEEKGLVG